LITLLGPNSGSGVRGTAVRDERKVEMTNDIEELIELSLSEARSAIEENGSWEPLVRIFHPNGVESIVIGGLSADPRQKDQLANRINSRLREPNGLLVIMVTDCWVGKEIPVKSMTPSLLTPFHRQAEALTISVWGLDGVATCGVQMYRRCADGKIEFEELKWEEPSAEFRFARGNTGQQENVLGLSADSRRRAFIESRLRLIPRRANRMPAKNINQLTCFLRRNRRFGVFHSRRLNRDLSLYANHSTRNGQTRCRPYWNTCNVRNAAMKADTEFALVMQVT
jgi:hypothetical protein